MKFYKTSFPTNFDNTLSFILSFLFPHPAYIYFHCSYLYIYCNYSRPCALNADFQHFILRFNENFLTLQILLKEGIGGEREGDFTFNFNSLQSRKRCHKKVTSRNKLFLDKVSWDSHLNQGYYGLPKLQCGYNKCFWKGVCKMFTQLRLVFHFGSFS
jgi:hypothetical protein